VKIGFPRWEIVKVFKGTLMIPHEFQIQELRRVIAEKFPSTRQKPGGILPTRLADVDAVEGGLRRAAVTELSGSSGAGALFLQGMLRAICAEHCFAALVDAGRSFEPGGPSSALARLLVVFCPTATLAVKAADLLLRDGNLSLVLLDLQAVAPRELQRIPANAWHRLQRLAEQTTAAVVVLTPQPMVEAAHVRIAPSGGWTLDAQRRWRRDLVESSTWRVFPRRKAIQWSEEEEEEPVAEHASA
jgi:hypothetical protein